MLLKNSAVLFSAQVLSRFIRFLYLLILAHLLGPQEVGLFLYGIALYLSLLVVAEFGQHVFLSRRLGKTTIAVIPILRNSLTIVAVSTLLACAGLALFIVLSEPPDTLWIVMSFVGALGARALASWVRFAFIAVEDPGWIPRVELAFRGLELILGSLLLLSGGGLVAICLVHCLAWMAEAVFALSRVARRFPRVLHLGGQARYLRLVTAESSVFLVSAAAMMAFSQLAVLLLRHIQDDLAFVGQFGIAMQFLTVMLILPMAIGAAFLPRLSRAYLRGDGGSDLVIGAKLLGSVAVLIGILAAGYGPAIIERVLGEAYAPTADTFGRLSWAFMPYALAVFVGQSLNVIDRRYAAATVALLMVVTQGGLLLGLFPLLGEAAIVLSILIGSLVGMALSLRVVHRQIPFSDTTWPLKLLATTALAYTVLHSGYFAPWLLPLVALSVAVALIAALGVLNSHDLQALRRIVRQSLPVTR